MDKEMVQNFDQREAKFLIKELVSSPAVMTKLKKQLMAVAFAMYVSGLMKELESLVEAQHIINGMDAAGGFVKEQVGDKVNNQGGDSSTN